MCFDVKVGRLIDSKLQVKFCQFDIVLYRLD